MPRVAAPFGVAIGYQRSFTAKQGPEQAPEKSHGAEQAKGRVPGVVPDHMDDGGRNDAGPYRRADRDKTGRQRPTIIWDLGRAAMDEWDPPIEEAGGMEPVDDGALLSTETRVAAVDAPARRAFRGYWLAIAPFSALIRRRWLAAAERALR